MREAQNRWPLRLLAIIIAAIFWYFLSFDDRARQSERVVQAAVSYNVPSELLLLDPVDQVAVRLRGNEKQIRTLNPFQVSISVDLAVDETFSGSLDVRFGPDNVFVPPGLEVIGVDPELISVVIEQEVFRTVPLEANLVGEPAAGATVEAPILEPAEVIVRGPRSAVEKLRAMSTEPVNLDGHGRTFTQLVRVVSPDPPSRVEPAVVEITIPLKPPELSEQALAGPIVPIEPTESVEPPPNEENN